jgi:hypothetical protein
LRSVHHDGTTVTLRFPAERSVAAPTPAQGADATRATAKVRRREPEAASLSQAHAGGD